MLSITQKVSFPYSNDVTLVPALSLIESLPGVFLPVLVYHHPDHDADNDS